ncbi:MAG: hypothetical protein J6X00_03830 [Clostridia bacterium]|nr:hypothetical protein [Clostridia bacterium]
MRKRNVFITIFVLLVSALSFWACNPYRNYNMSVSETNIVLQITTNDDNTSNYESKEISVQLSGGNKSINKSIELPTSDFVNFEKTGELNGTTTLKLTPKKVGDDDIIIHSSEGNLTQKIHVQVVKPVKDVSFTDSSNLAVEAGGTLDFSVNANNYVRFYPFDTTDKNLHFEVVEDGDKTGYAYFDGSVLHAKALSPDESEIYPTVDGQRYITIKVISEDNPHLTATTVVQVANIVNTQTISMNPDVNAYSSEDIILTPNSAGEYEVILTPESLGGVSVSNEYASHRTIKIMMGESSVDHANYVVNQQLTNTPSTDPNKNKLGFEYDSSSNLFTFTLTGVTPGVVRKSVFIDHKDYIGKFTKEYKFVVKTINIPTVDSILLNNNALSGFTEENPLFIYNGYYSAGGMDTIPFALRDKNLDSSYGYTINFDYNQYMYSDNKIQLRTESNIDVINNNTIVSNGQTLYLKHNYESVNALVAAFDVSYKYSLKPSNGSDEDYITYNVDFQIPFKLKMGVSAEEVDSLASNYYINSANSSTYDSSKVILALNELLVAEEQVERIEQNNDLVEFILEGNNIKVRAKNKSADGITLVTIYFANGRVSKQMVFTTYIPMLYQDDNSLLIEIQEDKVFSVGSLYINADDEIDWHNDGYNGVSVEEPNEGEYPYYTITDIILPTGLTDGMTFSVKNIFVDNGWQTKAVDKVVIADNTRTDYLKWDNGKLYTYDKATTNLGAEGYYVPVTLTLSYTGYTEGALITERVEHTVEHTINVWIFDEVTDLRLGVVPGTELYDANRVGAKLQEEESTLTPHVTPLPYRDDSAAFGVTRSEFYIQSLEYVQGGRQDESLRFPKYYSGIEVTPEDIVRIEEGTLFVCMDEAKIAAIAHDVLHISTADAYEDLYGNGIRCNLVGKITQFGIPKYTQSYVILKTATKVNDIIFNGVGNSGIYFEYRNGIMTNSFVKVEYNIYPVAATNKQINAYFEPLDPADAEGFVSNYEVEIEYTNYGGIITVKLKDGVDFSQELPQEYLVVVPYDSYVLNEEGEEVLGEDSLIKRVLISYGNGTENAKFQIRSAADLERAIADTEHYYYVLANDINLQGYHIANGSQFNGNLSGKFKYYETQLDQDENEAQVVLKEVYDYYNFYGLNVNYTITQDENYNIGLFGEISHNATVSDISINNAFINITIANTVQQAWHTLNVGILAGTSQGTIINSRVSGEVIVTANGVMTNINAGGMVGLLSDVRIDSEYMTPYIKGYYKEDNTETNTNVGVAIYAATSGNYNAGGLVGKSETNNENKSIRNIENISIVSSITITDKSSNVIPGSLGGIIGYSKNTNAYNVQVISSIKGHTVGGAFGTMLYGRINHIDIEFGYSSSLKNSFVATHTLGGLVGHAIDDGSATQRNAQIQYSYVRSYTTHAIDEFYKGALVLEEGGEYVGGIVGNVDCQLTIDSSYFDADLHVLGQGGTATTVSGGEATTNDGDGIANVGGFMGAHTKSTTIQYSYAKGRLVVEDGSFGLVSGSEIAASSVSPEGINSTVTYDFVGSLSDEYFTSLGDATTETSTFSITKTDVGTTYVDHFDVTLKNDTEINYSYVSFNENVFATSGGRVGIEKTTKFDYRTTVATKTIVNITISLVDNANVGTPESPIIKIYYAVTPMVTTITTTAAGTSAVQKTHNVDYFTLFDGEHDSDYGGAATAKLIRKYLYEHDTTDQIIQVVIDAENIDYRLADGVTEYIINSVFIEVDYQTENPVGVHAKIANNGDNSDVTSALDAFRFGGYKSSIGNTILYDEIKYTDNSDPNNPHAVKIADQAQADAQLLALLKKALGTSYNPTTVSGAIDAFKTFATDVVDYDGTLESINTHITFGDAFAMEDYDYFHDYAFNSSDITTGTVREILIESITTRVDLTDTKGNNIAEAKANADGGFDLQNINEGFKWLVLKGLNSNMPVIIEYVGDEDNNDSVLYRALYSSFPTIYGKVIDYNVTDVETPVQQYYKLTDESVVLLQGKAYSLLKTTGTSQSSTSDELLDVIEIQINEATISSIYDTNSYFVQLLSKNQLNYYSNNKQVLSVDENNNIIAQGIGTAILTICSKFDDSVRVDLNITVIPSFDSFKIKNLTTESSAYSSTVYVNEELALYAALMNGTSNVPSEYYGAILQFKDLDNTEEEGVILVNGLSKDYDLHYLESLDMLRVKGIELGRAEFMLTPFVYVTENTIGAESFIRADGTTAYIMVLENLTTTITTNIIQKAKSISIIGQNSVTINPDTTAVLDIVVESYTPDEVLEQLLFNVKLNGNRIGQELMDATDFMALGVEGADGNFKYIIDNYYEYLGSTTTTDDDGVLVYNHKYRITINMSDDKYYRSIATNNNYQNPLSSDIMFDFTFAAGSNHNLTTDFKLTLKANELTKMDVNYYPIGELDANGSFNPNETKSSKVVPGKEGLIKVTPQRFYNALNYVEVIALDNVDDIRFTQVQFNNGNGLYEELRNPATTIANGIRLWNVSYQVNGLNYYDNTYYIKMHTSSALPQGNTLRVQVNAYALDGSLLYSHTETFITEYLPSVSAEILTDQGYYDTFAEVALHSVTPIKFESKYLEGPVLYYISNLRDTTSTIDTNKIYLAKYVNDVLVRIPDNESVIINGEQYYLVVTDNYDVDEDNNVFLDITFMGSREMGGAIETTSTTIMVQVVYVKIDRVNLVGSYVDGANDLFLIRTGESSALQLALYSTNDTYEGGLLANQRTYLNAIADVFSGHLTLDQVKRYVENNKVVYDTDIVNGGYYNPYGVVKGDNVEPINDQTAPQFRYSHVEMQVLNNNVEELYTYWEVQGTLISQVKLCATLDYYYDDNGYIQAYDGVSPKLAGRNYYTIRYYFILVIADGSTEDRPLPISNQLEFEAMLDNNEGSFILKSDIVLENYKPKDINVNLLDGNSFRIILKSFSEDSFEQSSTLGLFKSVSSSTMIKNLTLDIGQFYPGDNGVHLLDLTSISRTDPSTGELKPLDVTSLSFAFFAVTNSGCITNCAVVDTKGETNSRNEFLIKTNQKATGTTTYEAQVSGFVLTNSGSISNSYVGKAVNDKGLIEVGYTESNGEQSEHLTTVQTNAFDIYAGQKVAGFVLTNSGTISNSYAKGVGITNLSEKAYNSYSAGFVGSNSGKVYNSFAEAENIINFRPDELKSYGWQIQAVGSASGFVYTNSGDIQNAYSKLTIQVNSVNTGGFVYTNSGSIKNAYTTTINAAGIGAGSLAHGPFVGLAWSSTGAKQYGTLEHCYYLILDDEFGLGDDADKALEILETIDPAKPIMSNSFDGTGANFQTATPFEGFSITNNNDENTLSDYLWYVNTSATTPGECQGPTIVGATRKTISYRIHLGIKTQIDPVTGNEVEYNAYKWLGGYNFGSKRNPIIINTADGFVKSIIENSKSYTYNGGRYVIFGSSNSAYNSVYAPSYVRIVNDIDLNEQALNTMYYVQGTNVKYKISDLIFMGQIDGNGMTVSGIKLTSTDQNMRENYGLFSQIGLSGAQKETVLTNGGKLGQHANQTPRLFNINFEYKEISNKNAQKVGLLAGSVYDATIRMISITGPDSEVTDKVSVISGWNLVGGAAGLISGANTNISDITLKNIRIIANKNTIDVDPDYINLSGYYDEFEQSQSGAGKVKATRIQLSEDPDVSGVYEIVNLSDISYAGSFAGAILANNYKTFAAGTETIVEETSTSGQNPTINTINKTLLEIAETPEYLNLSTLGAEQNAVALRHVGSIHNITTTGIIDITSDNSSAMFGYIGNNTHISDAQVIIDTTQSGAYYHVYGHNFAGGIAAEMVGGVLERAEVRHDEAKQEDIDSKINKSTPAMISRLDFFKSSDSTKVNNSSIAVGGVAGFTESSILLDTYNKINVTNEDSRIAGGVVGYANKFNYLGFVYTTGDVLGREIMGGLVGLYAYNDYKLYLQEAFALNRWGSEIKNQSIFTKLQTNYYAIYGETYAQAGLNAKALTLPEIGNMYNGGKADQEYGDNLTGASSDKFSFIGSTIGKATLLPGTYRVASYTFKIGGANEGEVKGLLYTSTGQALTNATSTGSYIILPLYANAKYAKNLFINTDGEASNPTDPDNPNKPDTKISMPLYMKYDSANNRYIPDHYVADATIKYADKTPQPVPGTTAFNVLLSTYNPTNEKESIYRIAQKVLDKSVYFNKFNYNVFSTTYGVLSESKVTASVYKMTYTGGNSFVLPNSNMGNIYYTTNVEKNGSPNIHEAIRDTLVGGSGDTGIVRYNSILGKQTYFEMITGYFFSNGTGDFNYNYYKFNNEFDTQYGFTKYMKENKNNNGAVTSYTPDGSGTWYKQGLNEVYFPEYSYGKHSSFIKISTNDELSEEFGDDTVGKFYSLAPETENYTLTLNITTNRPQQFNNEFAGIIIGKVKVKDDDSINPKIRINANEPKGVTTFLRSIENATFVNVDIEVYVKGLRDFASTDSYNGDLTSFGTIARYV